MTASTVHSVIDMTPRHAEEIARLERECFCDPWSEKALIDSLGQETSLFLVCEEKGKVLGYVGCYAVCSEAAVTNVAVFPEYRRQGVAEALIKELIIRAEKKGCETVCLEVRVSNSPAISLYEKLGFENAGVRRGFYTNPREDAYVLIYKIKRI